MKEVFKNLFVGDEKDYEENTAQMASWYVIHACKDPFHRKALGYTTRGAPKGPNYYFLYDSRHHLVLNIVDGVSKDFYNDGMINEAIDYAVHGLQLNKKVFIHCNQGESRAPSIAMLILKKIGVLPNEFQTALNAFLEMYPRYNPSSGIFKYIQSRWNEK